MPYLFAMALLKILREPQAKDHFRLGRTKEFHEMLRPQHFLYFFPLPQGHGSLRFGEELEF
jgi:hypothetical protein